MIDRCSNPDRTVIVVDNESMARRIRVLNPDVDVVVNSMMIQADPTPPPRLALDQLFVPRGIMNRHDRRREAALARARKKRTHENPEGIPGQPQRDG